MLHNSLRGMLAVSASPLQVKRGRPAVLMPGAPVASRSHVYQLSEGGIHVVSPLGLWSSLDTEPICNAQPLCKGARMARCGQVDVHQRSSGNCAPQHAVRPSHLIGYTSPV